MKRAAYGGLVLGVALAGGGVAGGQTQTVNFSGLGVGSEQVIPDQALTNTTAAFGGTLEFFGASPNGDQAFVGSGADVGSIVLTPTGDATAVRLDSLDLFLNIDAPDNSSQVTVTGAGGVELFSQRVALSPSFTNFNPIPAGGLTSSVLTITFADDSGVDENVALDAFTFTAVPEPAALGSATLAAVAGLLRRRRR